MDHREGGAADTPEGIATPLHRLDSGSARDIDEHSGGHEEPGCRYIDGKRAANEQNEGGTGDRKSITRKLPPLTMEYYVFRTTVWAHFDPTRQGRLRLEEFEEWLSAPPPAASESVSWWHICGGPKHGRNQCRCKQENI